MRRTRTRSYLLLRNSVKQLLPRRFPEPGPIDDGRDLDEAEPVLMAWPAGVRKPHVGLVRDIDPYPYWTKYRRFLEANQIPFTIYDLHRSSWLADAEPFDLILWRPSSYPYELEECRRKFHLLEAHLGKLCYPSCAEMALYEDKITQYELLRRLGLPVIETFISHSEAETRDFLGRCSYPLVWKLTAGSGSLGVELLRSRRQAERRVGKVFDFAGRRTYWPYVGQKNYVYLQRFLPEARFDLRVIVIGDLVFGYYRDVPAGEFRASGMNLLRYGELPVDAILLARQVYRAFGFPRLAVDMLRDGDVLRIVEVASFTCEDSLTHLCCEGISGACVFDGPGDTYRFVPTCVWTQELALKCLLETRWLAQSGPVSRFS